MSQLLLNGDPTDFSLDLTICSHNAGKSDV